MKIKKIIAVISLPMCLAACDYSMKSKEPKLNSDRISVEKHLDSSKKQQDSKSLNAVESKLIEVKPGDTLEQLLIRANVTEDFKNKILTSEASELLAKIRPGQFLEIKYTGEEATKIQYQRKIFPESTHLNIVSAELIQDELFVSETKKKFEVKTVETEIVINHSLFLASNKAGLSDYLTMKIIEAFSGEIDFHKETKKGDKLLVKFDQYLHKGKPVSQGNLQKVEFILSGNSYQAFPYKINSKTEFFNEKGVPLKKTFLRSPLKFSRITSGFGRRLHPIKNIWKNHNGVDYGAPSGTPILATGNGIIDFKGVKGGYGNTVIINHGSNRSTLYAHMSKFSSIKKGSKVSQGDIIGYVGATGWATGPHLHYEFRTHSKPINPLSAKIPASDPLKGTHLKEFKRLHNL